MGDRIAQLFIEITGDGTGAVKALNDVKNTAKNTAKEFGTSTYSMTTGLKDFAMFSGIAVAGVYAGKKVYDATIKTFANYGKQVKDMTRLTGMNADESSRLIQVADDLLISHESLEKGMINAARNGYEPNITSLMELSEKYIKLQPGLERDQFLLEVFGKTGMDMAVLLEGGASGIKTAWGNVDESLIISDEASQSAEDYLKLVDGISDKGKGIMIKIGMELLPGASKILDQVAWLMDQGAEHGSKFWDYDTPQFDISGVKPGEGYSQMGASPEQEALFTSYLLASGALKGYNIEASKAPGYAKLLAKAADEVLSPALVKVEKAAELGAGEVGEFNTSIYNSKYASEEVGPVLDDYKSKYMNNKRVSWIVNFSINGGNPDAAYNYMIDGVVDPNLLRAEGGPAKAGGAYIVGERGPELMFPGQSGQVISNEQILQALAGARSNKNVTVNQSLNMGMAGDVGSLPGIAAILRQRAGRYI
jgi:hypothetical protein